MRTLYKLLLLNALTACGAPGSEDTFKLEKPRTLAADSAKTRPAEVPLAQRYVTRQYRGHYRRVSDTVEFQPCGMKIFNVFATPQTMSALRERYRWSSPWQGIRMFTVFRGAIVADTVTAQVTATDSGQPTIRTRFFVADVDSMRAALSTDCGGSGSR